MSLLICAGWVNSDIYSLSLTPTACKKQTLNSTPPLPHSHRIKDDRRENSIKGIRIWHCAFAASIILCSTPT